MNITIDLYSVKQQRNIYFCNNALNLATKVISKNGQELISKNAATALISSAIAAINMALAQGEEKELSSTEVNNLALYFGHVKKNDNNTRLFLKNNSDIYSTVIKNATDNNIIEENLIEEKTDYGRDVHKTGLIYRNHNMT